MIFKCFQNILLVPKEILFVLRNSTHDLTGSFSINRHLDAAIKWIITACKANDNHGISKGYNLLYGLWYPPYPETTGYTIPTLLNVSQQLQQPELKKIALDLADYLLTIRTREGGVGHWTDPTNNPIVFDTGQVLFGWLAAFDITGDEKYMRAALRAGNWLVSAQDFSGSWKDHQHLGIEKVIDTRVAWALLELNKRSYQDSFKKAALCNLNWALEQQDADGWFRHCSLRQREFPLTHTLAYTAEGLFECGRLLEDSRYIEAAQLTADALLENQNNNGSLAGTYGPRWETTTNWACLTGNCQMSRLWLSLHMMFSEKAYCEAAKRAIRFVAGRQHLQASSNICGGIAGSHPIYGRYERFKYPNWAAKFFVDALLVLDSVERGDNMDFYQG